MSWPSETHGLRLCRRGRKETVKKLHVDIWSDVVCPWCAIGKRRFEIALAGFARRDAVEVLWRSFELDPTAPAFADGDAPSRLARKFGRPREQMISMMHQVEETAARDGVLLDLVHASNANTFDAHRVIHLGAKRGVQEAVNARILRGFLAEREPVGDRDVLVRLASQAGLDAEEVRATLANDSFAAEVREDEKLAHTLGIRGVPFYLFGGVLGVSGAQPADVFTRALQQAWERTPQSATTTSPKGSS